MPQVDVLINGRRYQIACDKGQEEHLSQLAEYVDKRVQGLVGSVGQVGDARLLVMISLVFSTSPICLNIGIQEIGIILLT